MLIFFAITWKGKNTKIFPTWLIFRSSSWRVLIGKYWKFSIRKNTRYVFTSTEFYPIQSISRSVFYLQHCFSIVILVFRFCFGICHSFCVALILLQIFFFFGTITNTLFSHFMIRCVFFCFVLRRWCSNSHHIHWALHET